MMENFAWSKSLLQEVGRHYTYINNDYKDAWLKRNTGCEQPRGSFPDELLDSLIKTRAKNKLQGHVSQL
jgi:metallopeptidase MepB